MVSWLLGAQASLFFPPPHLLHLHAGPLMPQEDGHSSSHGGSMPGASLKSFAGIPAGNVCLYLIGQNLVTWLQVGRLENVGLRK